MKIADLKMAFGVVFLAVAIFMMSMTGAYFMEKQTPVLILLQEWGQKINFVVSPPVLFFFNISIFSFGLWMFLSGAQGESGKK